MGLGLAEWVLYFIIAVELIAAVVMLFGVLPEWGYVLAIEMAVVIYLVRLPHGFATGLWELTILTSALAVALSGSGKYSIIECCDRWVKS